MERVRNLKDLAVGDRVYVVIKKPGIHVREMYYVGPAQSRKGLSTIGIFEGGLVPEIIYIDSPLHHIYRYTDHLGYYELMRMYLSIQLWDLKKIHEELKGTQEILVEKRGQNN